MSKLKFFALISIILLNFTSSVFADEGMWMLPKLKDFNYQQMKSEGCKLNMDEIYNEEGKSAIKDAVIIFGRGCTGVTVSNQGLVFTNHHCGFGAIQKLSSMEHNYLMNGFTAVNQEDELPCQGLSVKYLTEIKDVTERFKSALPEGANYKLRKEIQDSIIKVIRKEYPTENGMSTLVKGFYSENEFYVFRYQEFNDIRLAFTPPYNIGKFGGETDNWMWPRHTCDFSVFRVYADKNNNPASYAKDNVPYQPKKYIPISTEGYKAGDFAMIIGNPGTTTRYMTSWGIKLRMDAANQSRIDVRGVKQDVWKSFMVKDPAIQIAYADKYAGSANYWKNSIGMNRALLKLKTLDRKKQEEQKFTEWANQPEHLQKYGNVIPALKKNYEFIYNINRAVAFTRESMLSGAEIHSIAEKLKLMQKRNAPKDSIQSKAEDSYKDYYETVDHATLNAMLHTLKSSVEAQYLPDVYQIIEKKFGGNIEKYTEYLYKKSAFSNKDKFLKAFEKNKIDFENDPAIALMALVQKKLNDIQNKSYTDAKDEISENEHLLEAGLKEISLNEGLARYPDANSTMRLTYGTIQGYKPADAVTYNYFTTSDGVLEKTIKGDFDFDAPDQLLDILKQKDFGRWADKNSGKLQTGFLSTNDITGGNSGSPIFNAKGELLGLAFDGNWESMSGDLLFEPELQRTINVDIRYMLFIMDKYGKAQRLLNELTIH